MADTTRWTVQDFADAAGKRAAPYPEDTGDAVAIAEHACLACGKPLDGRTAKTTGLPVVYCDKTCQARISRRRWRTGPDEAAALRLSKYSWGEW